MSNFCNNLFFYDNPPIELSQIITDLNPYMYTNNTKTPDKSKSINTVPPPSLSIVEKPNPKPMMELIIPNQKDTLFWCIYIIANGYNDFQQITRNHRVRQLEVQKLVIDHITKDKSVMKNTNMKFTNVAIQELMSDLLGLTKGISYQVMMSFCVFYNINIYMIDNNKNVYLKFISNTDVELPIYAIYRNENNVYSVDIEEITKDKQESIEKMICLDSYLRPLKTISNYKIIELTEFAKQLDLLEDDRKYKKQELYEMIYNKIRWD